MVRDKGSHLLTTRDIEALVFATNLCMSAEPVVALQAKIGELKIGNW
jgi:hypothetical protein